MSFSSLSILYSKQRYGHRSTSLTPIRYVMLCYVKFYETPMGLRLLTYVAHVLLTTKVLYSNSVLGSCNKATVLVRQSARVEKCSMTSHSVTAVMLSAASAFHSPPAWAPALAKAARCARPTCIRLMPTAD